MRTRSASVIIDDSDAGFSSSGNFFNFGADAQRLNTRGTGTANWDFTALPTGTYQISASWNGHASRDSDVEFGYVSTSGDNGTTTVNQDLERASFVADGTRWEILGVVTVAAGGVSSSVAPSITQSDLDAVLSYWEASGLSEVQLSLLDSVHFVLTDLPDDMLGGATSTTVLIDINAAGYGWFVDETTSTAVSIHWTWMVT